MIGNAQCTPNPIFTLSPIPGVYPPNIPIAGIPLVGISDGQVSVPYSQTLTLVVLEDTTMDIGFLLDMIDPTITPLMNSAGISTLMTVNVNHVTYDITGLPNNLTYACDINSCQYPSGINGCIVISGTSIQSGTFPIDVNMTINVQIPAITIPVIGTVIYPGSGQDIPAFPGQQYDLFIDGSSGVEVQEIEKFTMYPNPTSDVAFLKVTGKRNIKIYDNLGRILLEKKAISEITLAKEQLGTGLFIIEITDKNKIWQEKLIIN
tara:strand:- start:818 stop:1606 length:789 start_codon:yes stop_codon:yes gene_type:complete